MSVLPTHCTTRRGNKVSQSRLPVSLRHCPGWPSATTCGHHRWDWALPHGSRKQRTHSTELYSITVTNSVRIKSAFYTPPGAHQSSVPDNGSQLRHTSHQAQRVRTCCSHHEHHKQMRTTSTRHDVTLSLSELKNKFQYPPLHHHITSVDPGGIENMKLGHGRGQAKTPTFFLRKKH